MSAVFKRSNTINGKFKMLCVDEAGSFIDYETGELINVADVIYQCCGNEPFDLSVSQKDDTDITPTEG